MKSRSGFTLIELIIFVGIFSVAMGAFLAVFTDVSGIAVRQSSTAEVQSQSQFLLQTIQYYVERSSMVSTTADTATQTLVLRMPSSTDDPAIIDMSGTAVRLKLGAGAAQNITSNKVEVSNLAFTKRSNPGGKDSVAVSFTVSYATTNRDLGFSQSLRSGVARVSAATFDSDVVPNSVGDHALGTVAGHWSSINNTIFFNGSNVGIGTASPGAPLEVDGALYLSDATAGFIMNDGDSCWRVTVSGAGALQTAAATCP
jgi:type II secretory pathway pseudopilin PulG